MLLRQRRVDASKIARTCYKMEVMRVFVVWKYLKHFVFGPGEGRRVAEWHRGRPVVFG